ncbi:MAG: DUF4198 domain-containing protein [Gammaproteobacteria bacterium]|nr:DUF4198 domain-containing protein [Gammaproteobacteria bacterium]MBU1482257.1 DUF4198 domain-containing protein [Gammaproteobacteria bacterium]
MLKKKSVYVAVLYVLQLIFAGSAAADVLWLSEVPPSRRAQTAAPKADDMPQEHRHEMQPGKTASAQSAVAQSTVSANSSAKKHKHGGGTEIDATGEVVDNTHSGAKQVWLRNGSEPLGSAYAGTGRESETLTLLGLDGALPDAVMKNENGALKARIELPELGFYNAYLTQRMVHGDMLHVQIAKAELLHGTCCAKGIDDEEVSKPIINANVPLELVRVHYPDEKLFTRIVSGDQVNFTVLSFGKPVAGAKVSMTTQNGWSSSKVSDAEGRVAFTMIRDYYTPWLEFKKYRKQTYLMNADLHVPSKVVADGVVYGSAHYNSTLAGSYYPSPHDYRSYAWGLGISLFVIVFGGVAIYLYRRRRLKPYKEVRVDDKA